ncbi:TolC family protein [Mucilaginibacter lappiensis]|uniref:Outer membrane protein TolC n=1 Tax=Mucilaginibacter lappiensis TaxID=354630 RepID=A0A841JG79_9SPHI|nr:TolC family protein [Mucilaginibacter lappiensis]MBB6129927.1 outer membrane protein TolC [Mucilaginibacter lappiensis]
MQSLKITVLIAVGLLMGINTYAQQNNDPAAVSLKTLLNRVDQNAPTLLTDSAAIKIRRTQAAETHSNWLPNLRLSYQSDIGTNNNVAGPYFGFGIIPTDSKVRAESNTSAVSATVGVAALDWEIYNFGSYGAQNKVANSDIQVEQNQFANSRYQLRAYTIGNYLQLLRLHDLLGIQSLNIQRNAEILHSIQSLAKSGVRAGVDTSISEAELSKARLNYIELVNQQKQVQLQLSSVSGLPYQSIVPDTTAEMMLIGQSAVVQSLNPDTVNHPVINYYRSVYQNSLQRESMVKKSYNPKILLEAAAWGRGSSIDANDHFNSLSTGFGVDRSNYLVGIGVTYNLFDIRRRQLKLRTQKATTDYSLQKLSEQRQLLSISANQADVELETARQRLQEIPRQLKAANDGYRQKLSLYKSGLTDIIELNAALNILYRAETDLAQAKFAYSGALFQKAVTENQVNTVLNLLK